MNSDCMPTKSFDVIVIGSGIGGLTAALLLACAGKAVLVLEQHDRAGGYAHGFKRKRYTFDSGVHLTSGCGEQGYPGGQVIYRTLKAAGILDQLDFIQVDPFSRAYYPGVAINFPQSIPAFVKQMSEHFPEQQQGVQELLQLCLSLCQEVTKADEIMAVGDIVQIRDALSIMFEYRKATLSEVLDKFIKDEKLKAIIATNWPYLGLPPSSVSFLYWATMFIGYLSDGAYYCKGGFQKFANTLANGITLNGGQIRYKVAVEKIIIEEGMVKGVILESGLNISAETVISNADMQKTVYEMVGKTHFPDRFLHKIDRMKPSISVFTVYIATDLDLNKSQLGHESFCYSDFDHDINFQKAYNGDVTWISITIPTLADPGLAPDGEHLIILTTLLPYELCSNWQQVKQQYQKSMLDLATNYLPGLKDHILYIDSGSPATMERYTQNQKGAAYGWAATPEQTGPNRIQNLSPLDGLYFAGHWTSPGGGVYGVSVSGMQAAQQVLGIVRQDEFWALVNSCDSRSKAYKKSFKLTTY